MNLYEFVFWSKNPCIPQAVAECTAVKIEVMASTIGLAIVEVNRTFPSVVDPAGAFQLKSVNALEQKKE